MLTRRVLVKFIRSWEFSVGVFVLIAVAAIVGVAVGVMQHSEPGFFAEGPLWVCPRTRPPEVCVRSYAAAADDEVSLGSAEDRDAVALGVSAVNARLGFEMYRLAPEDQVTCEVTVTLGVPSERGFQEPGGSAVLHRGSETCDIDVANATGEMRALVLHHELGHCLGLAHDDYELSIMRPVQSLTPDRELPPRISDFDRDLLRNVYGGQW